MVQTTNLPSKRVTLRFPHTANDGTEDSYQLMELPAEILKQIEGKDEPLSLTIKGRPLDEAVLCTPSGTYALRSVGISNSLLVCRPPSEPRGPISTSRTPHAATGMHDLEIRDTSHEIMELIPQAPGLERIRKVLAASAWKGLGSEWDDGRARKRRKVDSQGREERAKEVKHYTMDQLRSVVQASEEELRKGLKARNVVEVDNRMIMLPPKALGPLLGIILNLLTIHATTTATSSASGTATTPSKPILDCLHADHDVPSAISSGVMKLFSADTGYAAISDSNGRLDDVPWTADCKAMVRIIGLAELENLTKAISVDRFEYAWREQVGEWGDLVDLKSLQGNYILTTPPASLLSSSTDLISYFPAHSLPPTPAVRFSDLFLTRTPWRPDDMLPFLADLYREGDTKERDKLVAKFVRVVKEGKDGVWWYPRRSG